MKGLLISVISLMSIGGLIAQTLCYPTSSDFLERRMYEGEITPKIKSTGSDYIKISKIVDSRGKRLKQPTISMAIEHNNELYVNFRYCLPYQNMEVFVKADIVGRFTAVVIDGNTSSRVRNGGNNYGGGLQGVLIKESGKWGASWEDSQGGKRKIVIFDMSTPESHGHSLGNLLLRKDLNRVLETDFTKVELANLSYEEVVSIIKEKNT